MKINRIEKQSLNAKPYCYNTKETNSFSEYIYKANERIDIKTDPWQILRNKYPDVVYNVGDIAMLDKNNLIPYRQDFPVSKLFEENIDLEKLALWKPKINSNIPTGFEDYIQADRARIPKGTRAVMIHPDVKDRMEKDIQYANDILSKVDNFFQREIMINEQLVPGCTLGMNQFVAVDADGNIGYNCSVTHGTNNYEEPWQKNITPSLIREMEDLYKEVDITSKSGSIQTIENSFKLDMAANNYTEDYQSILGKEGNRSSAFQATLQKALGGYLNAFLEEFSRKLENNRKNARTAYDIQGNAGLDQNAVWSVYDKTMEQYRLSGNVMEALIKGAESGRAQYAEKMESSHMKEIYRYKNSGSYWNDFFGNSSDRKTGSYHQSGSIYEQYMMGWLDFKNSLGKGESVRMNLSLKPIDSYSINQSGNWVSTNV